MMHAHRALVFGLVLAVMACKTSSMSLLLIGSASAADLSPPKHVGVQVDAARLTCLGEYTRICGQMPLSESYACFVSHQSSFSAACLELAKGIAR